MNKILLFSFLLLLGCASSTVKIIPPPQAYLSCGDMPAVPSPPVNNMDLVSYLYALHDTAVLCMDQLKYINIWSDKIAK